MKNITLTQTFTLKQMLQSIQEVGYNGEDYEIGYNKMMEKLKEYLRMIE